MEYYTKRKKNKYIPVILIIITIIVVFNIAITFFDKRVMPSLTEIAEIMARSQALDIINQTSVEILSEKFNYDEMIRVEKDNDGNINLIQADTVKLNYIASQLAVECNKSLGNMNDTGIKVPLGWMSDKSIFYNLGPKVTMKIEPVGNISTSYESKFESAGINQTRHKIYLNVTANMRIKLPIQNKQIQVNTQIPVSDTIIVGKIPNTTLGFGSTIQDNSNNDSVVNKND